MKMTDKIEQSLRTSELSMAIQRRHATEDAIDAAMKAYRERWEAYAAGGSREPLLESAVFAAALLEGIKSHLLTECKQIAHLLLVSDGVKNEQLTQIKTSAGERALVAINLIVDKCKEEPVWASEPPTNKLLSGS